MATDKPFYEYAVRFPKSLAKFSLNFLEVLPWKIHWSVRKLCGWAFNGRF